MENSHLPPPHIAAPGNAGGDDPLCQNTEANAPYVSLLQVLGSFQSVLDSTPAHHVPAPDIPNPLPDSVFDLCGQLITALHSPDYAQNTLRRQAHLLDRMLVAMLQRHLRPDEKRGYAEKADWVELILTIQKQCADTLRAAAAIDYMQALMPRLPSPSALAPPPISGGTD